LSERYLKNVKKWDLELGESLPRKAAIKIGVALLLLGLLVFIWFLLMGLSYFLISAFSKWNTDNAEWVSLFPLFLVGLGFWRFGKAERQAVIHWKKVKGRIDLVRATRNDHEIDVGYEYGTRVFRKSFSDENGLMNGDPGDPAILLVNPEKPEECYSYGGCSWKAVKADESNVISS
jgi:uncharacterized membrane protein YqjE